MRLADGLRSSPPAHRLQALAGPRPGGLAMARRRLRL